MRPSPRSRGPQLRDRWLALAVLACALILAAAALGREPPSPTIHVSADHPVQAVYVRESGRGGEGAGPWLRVASTVPAVVDVKDGLEYEVMAECSDGWFQDLRGVQTRVMAGYRVQVRLHREIAWWRVLAAGLVLVAAAFLAVGRHLRRLKRETDTLTGALEQAERFATLRPGQDPRRIGRFRVVERLGIGGMATVFKVEDEYGDVCALKIPDPAILESEDLSLRFFREMEIGRMLRHPNIVRIVEVHAGDAETWPYIAQEYVDGETLRDLIRREAPFPADRALHVAREVAEALAYAHHSGVVHRDVKPANIMLTRAGDVRVMDFGIARVTTMDTMTGTDITLGTPQYMAPEQVDSHVATVRSDLYSLGVVLFEMLTGRLPFENDDPFRLMTAKMHEKAPRLSAYRPGLSRRLEKLLALLLQAEPERRPESAAKVSRMLCLLRAEAEADAPSEPGSGPGVQGSAGDARNKEAGSESLGDGD